VTRFTSAVTVCGFPAQNEQTAQRPEPFTVADGKRRRQTSKKFVSGCSTGFGLLEFISLFYCQPVTIAFAVALQIQKQKHEQAPVCSVCMVGLIGKIGWVRYEPETP
jgi:hypothetical protein